MITTLPDISPSYSSSPQTRFNVTTSKFGEGYSQRIRLGINATQRTWRLVWSERDLTDMVILENFFRARGGAESFLWIPPGATLPAVKWICTDFSGPTPIKGALELLASMTATLEEVFDI